MYFDRNQTEFPSAIHRAIWAVGKNIIPFEKSTAEIKDPEILEACKQVYTFSMKLYSTMYAHPERFHLSYGRNYLQANGAVTSFIRELASFFQSRSCSFEKNTVTLTPSICDEKGYATIQHLTLLGITLTNKDNCTVLYSEQYPDLFHGFKLLFDGSLRRKVNCEFYYIACDFSVILPRYRRTPEDKWLTLSDKEKRHAMELHLFLKEHSIKPEPHAYFERVVYRYKKETILVSEGTIYPFFQVWLGKNIHDPAYLHLVHLIEESHDPKYIQEMQAYIADQLTACNACYGSKRYDKRCGYFADVFGHRRRLCFEFCLSKKKKNEQNKAYSDYDIDMLKRFIELRIRTIDEMNLMGNH